MKQQQVYDQLASIASVLNKYTRATATVPRYDLLSGALYWEDELPPRSQRNADPAYQATRYLYRYRTTLILGKPDEKLAGLWEHATKNFPHWVGFDPARCRKSEELADLYRSMRKKSWIDSGFDPDLLEPE